MIDRWGMMEYIYMWSNQDRDLRQILPLYVRPGEQSDGPASLYLTCQSKFVLKDVTVCLHISLWGK